jgi:hypothetical protein
MEFAVTDPTLRLPNSLFVAVLDLGPLPLSLPALPFVLSEPLLDAEWDEENEVAALYLDFESGQIHFEATSDGIDFHYHTAVGDSSLDSPWSNSDTLAVIDWGTQLLTYLLPRLQQLLSDVEQAASWHHAGLTVYARDFGPVPLELIEVEMEGQLFMLPWLGAGHTNHEHIEEASDHRIALLWSPDENEEPDQKIAEAWLDPRTEEPKAKAVRGVDWAAVGLPKDEVLLWLEGLFLNNHIISDPAQQILDAALARMAGLDSFE